VPYYWRAGKLWAGVKVHPLRRHRARGRSDHPPSTPACWPRRGHRGIPAEHDLPDHQSYRLDRGHRKRPGFTPDQKRTDDPRADACDDGSGSPGRVVLLGTGRWCWRHVLGSVIAALDAAAFSLRVQPTYLTSCRRRGCSGSGSRSTGLQRSLTRHSSIARRCHIEQLPALRPRCPSTDSCWDGKLRWASKTFGSRDVSAAVALPLAPCPWPLAAAGCRAVPAGALASTVHTGAVPRNHHDVTSSCPDTAK